MRNFYSFIACLALLTCFATGLSGQGIYQFWGTTTSGGESSAGKLFTLRPNGTGQHVKEAFTYPVGGRAPGSQVPIAYNGKMYGLMRYGGMNDDGVIYEYDPVQGTYKKLIDLYYYGISHPYSNFVIHNDKFYATSNDGGNGNGTIFQFDPQTNTCTKKADMTIETGSSPMGELTWYNDRFYGLAAASGANNNGTIFSYDLTDNSVQKHWDFADATGTLPNGSLRQLNNLLWGTASDGGALGKGVIFSFNPATNEYVKKADFSDNSGYNPIGDFVLYGTRFYGVTPTGGAFSKGTLYEYDPLLNTLVKRVDMSAATGSEPRGNLCQYNQKLYGISQTGGSLGNGVIFEFNPNTKAFDPKYSLGAADGKYAWGGLMHYEDQLYGFTSGGADLRGGSFFSYDPVENSLDKKVQFGSLDLRQPAGNLLYADKKIYGLAANGGEHGLGGLYEYDLETQSYTVRYSFSDASGTFTSGNTGLTRHIDGKLYGTLPAGGANLAGTLFSYDPGTNIFTKLYDFNDASGIDPDGQLVAYDGKLYGITRHGSTNNRGTLFEYQPTSNSLSVRVVIDNAKGRLINGKMVVYNDRFYGTSREGGQYDDGTIWEYNPVINGFQTKYDFKYEDEGGGTFCGLEILNDKLYGITYGGTNEQGSIFEMTPGATSITVLHQFTAEGTGPAGSTLMAFNNKLYGYAYRGEAAPSQGSVFEFDPVTKVLVPRTDFLITNGAGISEGAILSAPAIVAAGDAGNCSTSGGAVIDASNFNEWVPFTNDYGDAIAEINANGNVLGRVKVDFYVHDGDIRKDGKGNMYLDRNITINADNQPLTPVSLRLYVRKTEFTKMKSTPNSGLITHGQLQIFKNTDGCNAELVAAASAVPTTPSAWGADYVYLADVSSFSSFYFGKNTFTVLPVQLHSFNGKTEGSDNKLEWKAGCTEAVTFYVERSSDGTNFKTIGSVEAGVADCDKLFSFYDRNVPGSAYYRLKMAEVNTAAVYSQIVYIERDGVGALTASIFPNPVTGESIGLRIQSPVRATLNVSIADATGRIVKSIKVVATPGSNTIMLPSDGQAKGVYYVRIDNGLKPLLVKYVKL